MVQFVLANCGVLDLKVHRADPADVGQDLLETSVPHFAGDTGGVPANVVLVAKPLTLRRGNGLDRGARAASQKLIHPVSLADSSRGQLGGPAAFAMGPEPGGLATDQ